MTRRIVVSAAAVAAAFLTSAAGLPATAGTAAGGAAPAWHKVGSDWPKHGSVSMTDVTSMDARAWAVGNTVKQGDTHPWVQSCGIKHCKRQALPDTAGGGATKVTSVSAADVGDVWAVGFHVDATGATQPLWWHFDGSSWTVVDTGITPSGSDSLALTQIEAANKSKAFAIGRYRYESGGGGGGAGVTSTLYRWNGNGWKELGPLDDTTTFNAPCGDWYQRQWNDVIVRPGQAALVGSCGANNTPVALEQGTSDWTGVKGSGLPSGVNWTQGAFVGQQLWLVGASNHKRQVEARDGNTWSKVAIKGLPNTGKITDLAGASAARVWAVGWQPTGHHHHIANSWRWSGGSWHETEVPAGVSKSRLQAVSVDGSAPAFSVGTDAARPPSGRALIIHST